VLLYKFAEILAFDGKSDSPLLGLMFCVVLQWFLLAKAPVEDCACQASS
jgi:hypothetical protein